MGKLQIGDEELDFAAVTSKTVTTDKIIKAMCLVSNSI